MNKSKLMLWGSALVLLLLLNTRLPVQARNCPKFFIHYHLLLTYTVQGEDVTSGSYNYLFYPEGKVSPTESNVFITPKGYGFAVNKYVVTNECGNLSFKLPFPYPIHIIDSNGQTVQTLNDTFLLDCRGLLNLKRRLNATCNGTFFIPEVNKSITITGGINTTRTN